MPNKKLELQKMQLQVALNYAIIIEKCDMAIASGQHVDYFRCTRKQAIENYADAIAAILESSIDIALEFDRPKFTSKDLLDTIGIITDDYRKQHNITC